MADFRQGHKHISHEACVIHLWKYYNGALTSSIEKDCKHHILLKMRGSPNFIDIIPRSDPHFPMIVGVKHP
jgi:hypothetical protein